MTPAVRHLERVGRTHRTLTYDIADDSEGYGTAAAAALGLDPAVVFKTLIVASDSEPGQAAAALVSVEDSLDLKAVAGVLGWKRAAMAEPADAARLTGYVIGGISPFGQRRALPTVLDDRAGGADEIFVSGGRRGLEIGLSPDDLVSVLTATVARIRRDAEVHDQVEG